MNGEEITADEAASILGVSSNQVRLYYRNGLLDGRRIGARVLVFKRADVEAFEKPKKPGRPRKQPAVPASAKPGKPAAGAKAATGKAPGPKKGRGKGD